MSFMVYYVRFSELNWILDRNHHVAHMMADECHDQLPPLDTQYDESLRYLPYTIASASKLVCIQFIFMPYYVHVMFSGLACSSVVFFCNIKKGPQKNLHSK